MKTKGEQTKQHILEQAISLFSKNSFKDVTIRQIAKEANISPALIYKYFQTQEDLYYAAMNTASNELMERLLSLDSLEQFTKEYLQHMFTSEVLFEIMTYFSLDQDYSKNFLPITDQINQFLQLLEEKISGPNAKIEAQLLFSTLNGLIISYKKVPNKTMEEKIASIQNLAYYYLLNLNKRL